MIKPSLIHLGSAVCLIVLLFAQCANPVAPRGGPRDQQPPQVDSSRSTPNFTTNFSDDRIVIAFDEWVKLNDAFNQIVFSPPFNEPPDVRLTRKKGVMVVFKDTLRDNTTYTINFGNAIQDITESNPAKDLRFVFSTGSFIDSLEVEGLITDALTGNAAEDVLVMLYENPYDSIVYRERPLYFAKTDKSGRFRIGNVKSGTFKIFALIDNNFNYLYDLDNELIGFIANDITINDTTVNRFQLKIFEEEKPLRIISRDTDEFGKITLLFNRAVTDVDIITDLDSAFDFTEHNEESVQYWYMPKDTGRFSLIANADDLTDTLVVRIKDYSAFLSGNPKLEIIAKPVKQSQDSRSGTARRPSGRTTGKTIGPNRQSNDTQRFKDAAGSLAVRSIHPGLPLTVYFNHPVTTVDTTDLILLTDSLKTRVGIDSIRLVRANRQMTIYHPWKEGKKYELVLNAGVLEDMYGLTNDSTLLNIKVKERKDFGSILSELDNLDSTITYIVDLYSPSKERIDRYMVTGTGSFKKDYRRLDPGSYEIRVTEDANNNGRWDTGDYAVKRQPERVVIKSLPPLRANWEVEAKISLNGR